MPAVAPILVGPLLGEEELDQISAILSDYLQLLQGHTAMLRSRPANVGAEELVARWLERAADLRDKIESR
jgi:hypothetical protein